MSKIPDWSLEGEIQNVGMGRPHVLILGAGASLASFPNGDKYGNRLPLMNNFVEMLSLEDLLTNHGVVYEGENFEALYSSLHSQEDKKDLVAELEYEIRNYFEGMALPDEPTIYDHLVLSLREKDLIATFNWDPFLQQALYRNHKKATYPKVAFLHGNVGIAICYPCKTSFPAPSNKCFKCGGFLESSPLLFPVSEKHYDLHPYIEDQWNLLRHYLEHAYILTIFGYGAPSSDVEAVKLMKEAWGDVKNREYEETEIIDIRDQEELAETWDPFIHTHHYRVETDFYDSFLAKHPRRSCEAMWNQLMECMFIGENPIPQEAKFEQLDQWFQPLIAVEKQRGEKQ